MGMKLDVGGNVSKTEARKKKSEYEQKKKKRKKEGESGIL